jgi:hypothetical protein
LLQKVLAGASSERTKNEPQGIGDEDFDTWMLGATL